MNSPEEQAGAALQGIADKLGMGADYFWPALMKQQFYDGMFDLIATILLSSIIFYLCRRIKKMGEQDFGGVDTIIAFKIMIVGLSLFILVGCHEAFTHLINPEYAALEDLFKMIRGKGL